MSGLAAKQSLAALPDWQADLAEGVAALVWLSNDVIVAADASGVLTWLDSTGSKVRQINAHGGAVIRLVADAGVRTLASAGEDGQVICWDAATGVKQQTLLSLDTWVDQLAWSAQGNYLAASAGRRLWIWDNQVELRQTLDRFPGAVSALAWSHRGARLLVGSYRSLQIFQPERERCLERFDCPNAVVSCAWGPNDSAFAAGSQDKLLQVWRYDRRQKLKQFTMRGYPGKVNCLSWRGDGKLLASAGGPDVVVWNVAQARVGGTAPSVWRGPKHTLVQAAFQPRGECLVAADRSACVRLWEPTDRPTELLQLDGEVTALAWRGDGRALVLGTEAGEVVLLQSFFS